MPLRLVHRRRLLRCALAHTTLALALTAPANASADTAATVLPPGSETSTPPPPPSGEATPAPVPRPVARDVRAPIVTRSNHIVGVSCVVSSSAPATLTLEYRRIVRGTGGAWQVLARRALTSPASSQRLTISSSLRSRGL